MTPTRVLVVDDAPEFLELLVPLLGREGFQTATAADGREALAVADVVSPDVVILDLNLPEIDGLEVCRRLRAAGSDAYILMLTARDDEVDRVVGLEIGADDYLTKPFSPRELVARLRAMLRRPRHAGADAVQGAPTADPTRDDHRRRVGEVTLDPGARTVTVEGRPVELTRIEFDLLATLMDRPRIVVPRSRLVEAVWGPDFYGDDHVVDVHIANLRRKLAAEGSAPVRTVRGVGYGMVTD